MRHYHLLPALLLCTTIFTTTAQKRQYTMAEAVNGIATTLAPKSVKQPSWEPGTHNFYQVVNNCLVRIQFPSGKVDTVRRLSSFITTSDSAKKLQQIPQITWIRQEQYFWKEGDELRWTGPENWSGGRYYLPTESNIAFHSITNTIVYTDTNNIGIITSKNRLHNNDGVVNYITSDTNRNIINGQAVHRNEFGIDKGIFFSPKGNFLAYYRMDQTMVEDYPVIDWSVTPATVTNVKYPMAGRKSHEVTLQVYNIATHQTTAIKTKGPKDQYLTCVTWSPDEKYIYIALLNRAQNHLWLNQYNAQTGEKIKTILQEADDKYVEPQHPLSFLPGSNTQFIWWSQRDGYMHLWLCDMATNKMRCLTPGDYVVNDLIGFNPRTKEVLLTSAKEDPREKHGYAVNWETGKMRRLDTEPGTHNYTASDDGEYLFDVFSSSHGFITRIPGEKITTELKYGEGVLNGFRWYQAGDKRSVIRNIKGTTIQTVLTSSNPLNDFDRPKIKDKKITTVDSNVLYGKLILPTNFDSSKKYPVIVYLYNGPHVQLIKSGFPESGNLWFEYLAQHGYIVWTMDGRGSSNRGLKFEQAVFRHLGTVEMEDQLKGVEFLKSLPYVDTTRMGVHGWSFGGFMTTSLMLRHPGVFKCAVAGGPVMDWSMYEVMYGERYMDTPEENPEGYKESALFDKVKNLKGKLMLIHGTQDATVVWQHSIKFLRACVDNGVQVDYFVYPGYEHNVRGKDRVHLMQKITDYFDANL